MKISEPLGNQSDQDAFENARRMEAEAIAEMKSEFNNFVAQTRERLRIVSESLQELGREYALAPANEPNADESGSPGFASTDSAATAPSPAEASALTIDAHSAKQKRSDTSESELDFWATEEPHSNRKPLSTEDASSDASFHRTAKTDGEVRGPRRTDRENPSEALKRPQASIPDDDDADPMERLNAIKQRLARQIENS
jgi:hypothetical protein